MRSFEDEVLINFVTDSEKVTFITQVSNKLKLIAGEKFSEGE